MAKTHTQPCPLARMLNVIGDRWTLLIVREAFYGTTRFSDFQQRTGIARNVLADRLAALIRNGLLTRTNVNQTRRSVYILTDKGRSLHTVIVVLFQWSDAHLFNAGRAPVCVVEKATGQPIAPLTVTSQAGALLGAADLAVIFRADSDIKDRAKLNQRKQSHAQNR